MIDEKEVLKILKRYEGRMNPTAYFGLEADIVNIEKYAEPRKGHWIFKQFDEETGISNNYWCSECGKPLAQIYKTYCSNCGAKMESEEIDGNDE